MTGQNPTRNYFQVGIALKNIHDEVLLIQEANPSQPDDHAEAIAAETGTAPSDVVKSGKWRLPCGRLHEGDNLPNDLQSAASVIAGDLTSYDFDEHGICYLGLCKDPHGSPCVTIIYAADQPYDVSLTDLPDPEEVAAAGWFTYDYLLKLNKEGLLRDPEPTLAAVKNAQQDLTVPPELITL